MGDDDGQWLSLELTFSFIPTSWLLVSQKLYALPTINCNYMSVTDLTIQCEVLILN